MGVTYKIDIVWSVPLSDFERFKRGEKIEDIVLTSWELRAGDMLGWEAGKNPNSGQEIAGIAEVVSCLYEEGLEVEDFFCGGKEGECLYAKKVPGVKCVFRKIY